MEMRMVLVREETFSFFSQDDGGEEIHIYSGRLREWLHKNAMDKIGKLVFPSDQTLEQLTELHGLEEPRLKSMTEDEAREPIIVGLCSGGTHILIDGSHRRAFWAQRGIHTMKGWAVPEAIWREFIYDPANINNGFQHPDGSLLPQRRQK